MKTQIPFKLHNRDVFLTVEYRKNRGPQDSGFDALLNLPFNPNCCTGYPSLHAYFENMGLTGYKRYCGFIQFVERQELTITAKETLSSKSVSIDVSDDMLRGGNPYFAYGYPAELYDAPCKNLGDCDKLIWRAFTYLVDIPSRMNDNRLTFLTGFSWGYTEDASGPLSILDLEILPRAKWLSHYNFLRSQCPAFAAL